MSTPTHSPSAQPALELLTYSALYPNSLQPRHGIFVAQRLKQLVQDCAARSRVVAPVPWFPSTAKAFGQYGVYASVPRQEQADGMQVYHPRFPVLPKVSWHVAPWLMYRATRNLVADLHRVQPFDVIDAHFFYPDGVAAVMLGRELGLPVTITARGSDITEMLNFALPRRWILWAAEHAQALVTVCSALRDRLMEVGVAGEKITVLRNGVDLDRFAPVDRASARAALGVDGPMLLSVGNLIELKGHHLILEALRQLPDHRLFIIGSGPDRQALEKLARKLGVDQRTRFMGLVPQAELRNYYGAADALILASSREGWANVLLEAMACGTPVVATRVWGTPEVVAAPAAGVLIDDRSGPGIADGVRRLFENAPARADTRAYAENFSWQDTSRGQMEVFARARQFMP
jgi:teichuronic acid biosynthesis glycosyltransferase TuaC